jgi:hypothetical protein
VSLASIVDVLDVYTSQSVAAAVISQTGDPSAGHKIGEKAHGTRRLLVEMIEAQQRQIDSLTKERDHWKANHADQVRRARVLLERHDLPLERVAAYDHVLRLQNALKSAISNLAGEGCYRPLIDEFEAILAGKPTRNNWLEEQY